MDGEPGAGPDGDRPAVARLARFNADQVRAIERALAEHLAVDTEYVTPDGFNVTPSPGGLMTVHWRGTASIDGATFNLIVATATAGDETAEQRWREHLPEPAGAQSRPRHFERRRSRRDADPTDR